MTGQVDSMRGESPRVGVANPGDGKAASIPERPDWRFALWETVLFRKRS